MLLKRSLGIVLLLGIFVVVAGGVFLLRQPANAADQPATEEASATEETSYTDAGPIEATPVYRSIANGFSITPAQVQFYTADSDPIPESLGQPAAGEQWALLTVSFLNEVVDGAVPVTADEITLFDIEGDAYSPLEDGGMIAPYMVGIELPLDQSVRGFVVFAIPESATPSLIQWCPAGDCESVLRADVILPVTE